MPVVLLYLALLLAAPILWCVALILHDSVSRILLKVHAAIFTVLFAVDVYVTHIHASPAYLFVLAARMLLVILVGVDLFVAHVSFRRTTERRHGIGVLKFLYLGLTMSAIAGLYLGVRAWSPTVPPLVISSAEATAGELPYCIFVDGLAARNANDLTGVRMQARYDGNWAYDFHALLVVTSEKDSSYFNWSYRTGRFEPLSENARWRLAALRTLPGCKSETHFARDWHL
jgi:hypothetical protein